jgi:hypothetical protein
LENGKNQGENFLLLAFCGIMEGVVVCRLGGKLVFSHRSGHGGFSVEQPRTKITRTTV